MTVLASETELKRQVVQVLRAAGWRVHVTSERRPGYTRMPVGLPDVFAYHVARKRALWIEVKRPGEALRPMQQKFRNEIKAAGQEHLVIASLEDLRGVI